MAINISIRQFTHDAAIYPDPMVFRPERFLGPNPQPDPKANVFGFGRRICPGMWLADTSVWITVAKALAVFNVEKVVQQREMPEQEVGFTLGVVSHPLPYEAKITPRSAKHGDLILDVERDYPWEKSSKEGLESVQMTERDYVP